jgi:carboxypeptidase Q
LKKIRLNLNFDMLASPNYVYAIYDGAWMGTTSEGRFFSLRSAFRLVCCAGDGDQFGLSGPSGSAQIEKVFEDFYDANGKAWTGTAFDGRSDYGECRRSPVFQDVRLGAPSSS